MSRFSRNKGRRGATLNKEEEKTMSQYPGFEYLKKKKLKRKKKYETS